MLISNIKLATTGNSEKLFSRNMNKATGTWDISLIYRPLHNKKNGSKISYTSYKLTTHPGDPCN